jgi:carbonic anhydrase
MCEICNTSSMNRRSLFAVGAGAAATLAMGRGSARAAGAVTSMKPAEALDALMKGNASFVESPQMCALNLTKRREETAGGQAPWAAILSCADSRVPPELLFGGRGIGELFVARNAGNLSDTDVLGTLEYGVEHLGVPLIVVLGHEKCGAIAAACSVVTDKAKFPGSIGPMVAPVVPIARAQKGKSGDLVTNTVKASAVNTAGLLTKKSKIINHLVHEGKVKVVAGYYNLASGKVDLI